MATTKRGSSIVKSSALEITQEVMKEKTAIVQSIHEEVQATFDEVLKNSYLFYSAMVLTKLLVAIRKTRGSLEMLQSLPMRCQEELAWLTLNACKLIYDIAQPLIWSSCGKYVIESLGFAALSMENVINLCTVRHMQFRMKLYASMIYCGLSQGQLDQAQGSWDHCYKQVKELQEREELDPPLPEKTIICIAECVEDVTVLKIVLDFWRDVDSTNFSDSALNKYKDFLLQVGGQYYRGKDDGHEVLLRKLRNRVIAEFTRCHALGSSNPNETYQKRSTNLAKAMESLLSDKGKQDNVLNDLSLRSLFEMAYLTILDQDLSLSSDNLAVFDKVLKRLSEEKERKSGEDGEDNDAGLSAVDGEMESMTNKEFQEKLSVLRSLQTFANIVNAARPADSHLTAAVFEQLQSFFHEINALLYLSSSYRSTSVYLKVVLAVFEKVLYRPLQVSLSEKTPTLSKTNAAFFREIAQPLQVVVKAFDLSFSEDPILSASLALLTGHVLAYIGEFREAISLLKQAVHNVEDHRALRVDFFSHCPEDLRDLLALQRSSFTTRSDSSDWFHSVKRLGAHAFAGFGIFGLSSSADRSDQALAELHTDLLALYFRVELQYSVREYVTHKRHRQEMAKRKAAEDAAKLDTSTVSKKSGSGSSKTSKTVKRADGTLVTTVKDASSPSTESPTPISMEVNMEKLPAVVSLQAFVAKNKYAQSLLLQEMAKLEENATRRVDYLERAKTAIEDAEAQEETLVRGFADFTVMTDAVVKHPIVVSRSHRFIYVCPVGCRKQHKATHFRVLAKEKGSGTDVTVYNNALPGCATQIDVAQLVDFSQSVVRIGPLRNGELYVFGSAGYNAQGEAVSAVSPTTPMVEAVNPLPTILLWASLAQTAAALGLLELSMDAAIRVCHRFLLKQPIRPPMSLSNGLNFFMVEECTLCTLAVQQSTTNLLHHFVQSFVLFETLHFERELFGRETQWVERSREQLRYLSSLKKCGVVVTLAAALRSQDLTMRVVSLALQILSELLRFDAVALARHTQTTVVSLLLAMQRVPKRQWHEFEHRAYYKLLTIAMQLGLQTRDVSPLVALLGEFFSESREKDVNALAVPLEASTLNAVEALLRASEQFIAPAHREPLLADLKRLFLSNEEKERANKAVAVEGVPDDVSLFWKLSALQRRLKISGISVELVEGTNSTASAAVPERVALEKSLFSELPLRYSDYLALLAQLMRDLLSRERAELVDALLQKMPLCADYLLPAVRQSLAQWRIEIALPIGDFVAKKIAASEATAGAAAGGGAAAAAKKAAPKKGAAAAEAEPSLQEQLLKIPERFSSSSAASEGEEEETALQRAYLAEILSLLVSATLGQSRERVNHFVSSAQGPRRALDAITHYSSELSSAVVVGDNTTAAATPVAVDNARKGLINGKQDLVKCGLCAVALLGQAARADAAVVVATQVWNFLVAEYVDPVLFVREYCVANDGASSSSLREMLLPALVSLSEIVHQVSVQRIALEQVNPMLSALRGERETESEIAVVEEMDRETQRQVALSRSAYAARECREKLHALLDLLVFVAKALWLVRERREGFVLYASRVFALYFLNAENALTLRLVDHVVPLVLHAQRALIDSASSALGDAQETLRKFVAEYEDAQQKKRKRRVRVARVEKDEEELAFEAQQQALQEIVYARQAALEQRNDELRALERQQQQFLPAVPRGAQLLGKARAAQQLLFSQIEREFGRCVDCCSLLTAEGMAASLSLSLTQQLSEGERESDTQRDGVEEHKQNNAQSDALSVSSSSSSTANVLQRIRALYESIDSVSEKYKRAIKFLRDNKERVSLSHALLELANVLLRFGLFRDAQRPLLDVVDGVFNTMDACTHWPAVVAQTQKAFDFRLIPGVINVLIALGKLCKFYTATDYEAKARFARFAAELSPLFFAESVHHPRAPAGFAAYECVDLGGLQAIPHTCLRDLHLALLDDLLPVLLCEEHEMAALPLVVLGEYLASHVLRSAAKWLEMRRFRVRCCVKKRFFAEAISMLSGIAERVPAIADHSFAEPQRPRGAAQTERLSVFETSRNGLCFHGAPVFVNNAWPSPSLSPSPAAESLSPTVASAAENARALAWLHALPAELEAFFAKFVVAVPESELGTADRARIDEQRRKAAEDAAAAATEAAKKSKGKAALAAAAALPEPALPTVRVFSSAQVVDLRLLCAELLSEVAALDGSTCNARTLSEFRGAQWQRARELLAAAKRQLSREFCTDDVEEDYALRVIFPKNDAEGLENVPLVFTRIDWFTLYARMSLLEARVSLSLRHFRMSLYTVNHLMRLMQHARFRAAALPRETKYFLTHFWLSARCALVAIAQRQARWDESDELLESALAEAQIVRGTFFVRKLIIARARTFFARRDYERSLSDCERAIALSESLAIEDDELVRLKILHADILREKIRFFDAQSLAERDARGAAYHLYHALVHALSVLRDGYRIGQRVMQRCGGLAVDVNATFSRAESNVSGFQLLPPPLHTLTDLHNNEQPLSVTATETNEIENTLLKKGKLLLSAAQKPLPQSIRLGPIDADESTLSPCEFCNVYLKESRVLLSCQLSLLILLDDVRCMGVGHWMSALIDQINEEMKTGLKKKPLIDLEEENLELLKEESVLFEEMSIGEETLKLMRQVIFVPPAVRGKVYLYVAKARIAKRVPPAPGKEAEHQQTLLGPLIVGLKYLCSANATYLWPTIKAMCVELVEVFGDASIDLGDVSADRLKQALQFLLMAIAINNQQRKFSEGSIELSGDLSFAAIPLPEELQRILTNEFLSSMSAPLPNTHPAALAAAAAAAEAAPKDAAGAKGAKGAKAGAAAAPTGAGAVPNYVYTGRDAIHLLSTLSREVNAFQCDSDANDLAMDVHLLLKKTFPVYEAQCSVAAPPSLSDAVIVPATTTSTAWTLTRTPADWFDVKKKNSLGLESWSTKNNESESKSDAEAALVPESKAHMDSEFGFYSHAGLFFILGDAKAAAPAAPPAKGAKADPSAASATPPSTDPVLTKVVLFRGDVLRIEKGLRYVRQQLLSLLKTTTTPASPENQLPLARLFAQWTFCIASILQHGFITADAFSDSLWGEDAFVFAENAVKVQVDRLQYSLPFTVKVMTSLANVFTTHRDMFQIVDADVCSFLRLVLGHKTA